MKVSICIPVYNVEKYIRRCLESVEDQTYQNIEIIVVNDCSPDNSMAVVHEFAQADSRIVLLNHESNKGLMMARKTAYMNATGDYITFLDSDDYLPSTSIENLVYAIHTTGADVVSGCIEYIPCIGEKEIWQNELKYGSDSASVLKSLLKKEFGHNLCGKIFKRELLQCNSYTSYNNFNNGEDGMLFYQIVKNCSKIVNTQDIVYFYCQNLQSSSQVRLSESGLRSIFMLNKIRKEICSLYPNLYKLLFNYISPTIISLYLRRYIDSFKFKMYIHDNNLEEFVKIKNILRYLSIKNSILLLSQFIKTSLRRNG